MHIYLVEDDPSIARLLQEGLGKWDLEVSLCRDFSRVLVRLMMAGAVIMGVFVAIFYLYTSRFAFSQRQKEFALYAIYGMEGRDVGLILAVETVLNSLFILALSTGVGFLLGKVLFVLLNRLLQYDDVRLSAFPFRPKPWLSMPLF